MPDADRELEVLAAFVHGGVAFGNALGLLYNLKRRSWFWSAIHGAGVLVHTYAAREHAENVARNGDGRRRRSSAA